MRHRVGWTAEEIRLDPAVPQRCHAALRIGLLLIVTCLVVGCDDLLTETPPAGDDF